MGHRFEGSGAPLRPRAQKCPTSRRNRAPLRSKLRPTSRRNQCPISSGIRICAVSARGEYHDCVQPARLEGSSGRHRSRWKRRFWSEDGVGIRNYAHAGRRQPAIRYARSCVGVQFVERWGASRHTYSVPAATPPITLTAVYVPGGRVTFLTNPPLLKLNIDGRDDWPSSSFSWAAGEKHTVSAQQQPIKAAGVGS